MFPTVQCTISRDGGYRHTAGYFRIYTHRSSNLHFLLPLYCIWQVFLQEKNTLVSMGMLLYYSHTFMFQSSQWFWIFSPHHFCVLLQKEISRVMRLGMDQMLQFEKNTEKTERIYTYEKAVERYYPTHCRKECSSTHEWYSRSVLIIFSSVNCTLIYNLGCGDRQ